MIPDPGADFFSALRDLAPDFRKPVTVARKEFADFCHGMQEDIITRGGYVIERAAVPGPDCFWITLPGVYQDRVLLFFHGGGFTMGSTADYLGLCIRLAKAARARVFSVDYRLAPEHVFPAAVDDAVAAYRHLMEEGIFPHHIIPVGISAGGTLVLDLLLTCRDKRLGFPSAAICMCPATDMLFPGASVEKNKDRDWITPERLHAIRAAYLAGHDPHDSLASPVNASLRGLPRLYVQAGTHELLASDIAAFVEKARWSGTPVQAVVWEGMFHSWQLFAGQVPEGQEAIEDAGRFALEVLSR